eukprot:m.196336 g.196336  ORF g.196336 m.196336 type:complete len:52 (-) comp13675_c0_seq5:1962-2117(-)
MKKDYLLIFSMKGKLFLKEKTTNECSFLLFHLIIYQTRYVIFRTNQFSIIV